MWADVLATVGPYICHFHDERSKPILVSNPFKKMIISTNIYLVSSIDSALLLCKEHEMISLKIQMVYVVQAVQ